MAIENSLGLVEVIPEKTKSFRIEFKLTACRVEGLRDVLEKNMQNFGLSRLKPK
jgi:hypothetical protein